MSKSKEDSDDLKKLNIMLSKNRPELKGCLNINDEITCNSVEFCQWDEYDNKCQLVEYFNNNGKKVAKNKINNKFNFQIIVLFFVVILLLLLIFRRKK